MFAASALPIAVASDTLARASSAPELTFSFDQYGKRLDILRATNSPFSLEKQNRDRIRHQKTLDEIPAQTKHILGSAFEFDSDGLCWHSINQLPKCRELVKASKLANRPEFERQSETFLFERYGVSNLDEALVVTGFYEYVEFMLDLADENEAE